jgi:hypothetical protein
MRLERDTDREITTTKRGKRFATSIDGTLTGLGGNLIIIDDPLKLGDAMSESVRTRVIEWYRSTLLSRADRQEGGAYRLGHAAGASGRSGRLSAGARWLRGVEPAAPLLAAYVQSILPSRSAVKHAGKDPAALALWEKSTRMTATLATRLRLSPQSRLDPKSVGRMRPYNGPRPWDDDFLDKREALNANAD